jgi:hypothetical protein
VRNARVWAGLLGVDHTVLVVLLLALGLASAGTALGLSKARAQSALRADGPMGNSAATASYDAVCIDKNASLSWHQTGAHMNPPSNGTFSLRAPKS